MYCPNCGQQIPDSSEFCGFCGAKIVLPDFSITAAPDAIPTSSTQNTQY